MTQIVFPYYSGNNIDLCGTKVYHFESVLKRIEVGKTLYVLLFYSNLHDSIYTFSLKHPTQGLEAIIIRIYLQRIELILKNCIARL
ncbi:DUF2515 family protein [Priestia megaterium]